MVWTLSNRLLFAAIFISGASALIYQLIWVRLLGLVFGVSSFAVATVVAVFLLAQSVLKTPMRQTDLRTTSKAPVRRRLSVRISWSARRRAARRPSRSRQTLTAVRLVKRSLIVRT